MQHRELHPLAKALVEEAEELYPGQRRTGQAAHRVQPQELSTPEAEEHVAKPLGVSGAAN